MLTVFCGTKQKGLTVFFWTGYGHHPAPRKPLPGPMPAPSSDHSKASPHQPSRSGRRSSTTSSVGIGLGIGMRIGQWMEGLVSKSFTLSIAPATTP